jgi:hypothetical protein
LVTSVFVLLLFSCLSLIAIVLFVFFDCLSFCPSAFLSFWWFLGCSWFRFCRSRRGWVMEPVEQTTSRGTKMPAYRIRWRDSERPEIVLQHMLIADPDPTPPPEGVSLEPPAPKA